MIGNAPLTSAQAVAVAPTAFADPDTVKLVQASLLRKGYVDGGPADGDLGSVTADSILSFRARNDLPLTPTIDHDFLQTLAVALPKEIPERVAAATVADIAPKVEAVQTNIAVQHVTWWSKLYAWVVGLPSISFAILSEVVDKLGPATETVTPVKNLFSEIPVQVWVGLFGLVAVVFGYQAYRIKKLSVTAENSMVAAYKIGTVKDDAPKPPMPPPSDVKDDSGIGGEIKPRGSALG